MTSHPRRALVLGALLVLLCAGCGGQHLGKKGLERQAESLQSAAAEGALLATDSATGRTTRTYTREHAVDLHAAAARLASGLKAAKTESELEPTLRRLRRLAAIITGDLDRLEHASKAEQRALAGRLRTAARAGEQIGSRLS